MAPFRINSVAVSIVGFVGVIALGCGGASPSGGVRPDDKTTPDASVSNNPPPKFDSATPPKLDAPASTTPPPTNLPNGRSCSSGSDCQSGECVDGVCCNNSCASKCSSCVLPGSVGTCMPVPAGQDPDNECSEDPVSSGKQDGTCDGNGACRLQPDGTECQAPSCFGQSSYSARTCDGKGVCQQATSQPCPTRCNAGVCDTTCSDTSPCQS